MHQASGALKNWCAMYWMQNEFFVTGLYALRGTMQLLYLDLKKTIMLLRPMHMHEPLSNWQRKQRTCGPQQLICLQVLLRKCFNEKVQQTIKRLQLSISDMLLPG